MTDMIKAQREQLARIALDNSDLLDELFTRLESSSRRERQNAAATLSAVASFDPQAVFSRIDAFVNALDRPEAQLSLASSSFENSFIMPSLWRESAAYCNARFGCRPFADFSARRFIWLKRA